MFSGISGMWTDLSPRVFLPVNWFVPDGFLICELICPGWVFDLWIACPVCQTLSQASSWSVQSSCPEIARVVFWRRFAACREAALRQCGLSFWQWCKQVWFKFSERLSFGSFPVSAFFAVGYKLCCSFVHSVVVKYPCVAVPLWKARWPSSGFFRTGRWVLVRRGIRCLL